MIPVHAISYIGIAAASGYLIGAIPFGLLIARSRGVDIRSVGSGNIGATNVFRTVGKPWGLLTFGLDFLKGLAPTLAPAWWLPADFPQAPECALAGGVAAIVGHSFSVFLRFRGGKGVATSAGVLAGLAPLLLPVGAAVWILLLLASRMVSLASMGAAGAVAAGAWLLRPDGQWTVPAALSLLAALVVFRHRANIRRIVAGTEPKARLGRRPPDADPGPNPDPPEPPPS